MIESAKITAVHRQRLAVVYVRQSSPGQLERNRESTMRQYNFVARAVALGWAEAQVIVIDEDQGVSASGLFDRAGFAQLTAEVALAHVGIVLGLELSRLSRNNRLCLFRHKRFYADLRIMPSWGGGSGTSCWT